jgi:ELWxxDGT repeat protein
MRHTKLYLLVFLSFPLCLTAQIESLSNFGTSDTILNFRWADQLNDSVSLICTFNPRAIWRTDGTKDGTFLIKEFAPWVFNPKMQDIVPLGIVNGKALFVVYTVDYGNELWAVDPLGETCDLVVDLIPGPDGITPNGYQMEKCRGWVEGNTLYFSGQIFNVATDSREQLIISTQGDAANTSIVMSIPDVLYGKHDPKPVFMYKDTLYSFIIRPTETVLLRLHPTINQVDTVFKVPEYQDFIDYWFEDGKLMMLCNGFLFYNRFWFYDFSTNSLDQFDINLTQEYWTTNEHLQTRREFYDTQYGVMFAVGKFGTQSIIYRSDGTLSGTVICEESNGSGYGGDVLSKPKAFVDFNNDVLFWSDYHLYRYNPIGDGVIIRFFNKQFPIAGYQITPINGKLFLPGHINPIGGDTGFEPYLYDPATNTWELIANLNPGKQGSNPVYHLKIGKDKIAFVGFTAAQADELFVFDGKSVSVISLSPYKKLTISPNPAVDMLTICGLNDIGESMTGYTILDGMGRPLGNSTKLNTEIIYLEGIPSGTYYLQLQFEKGSHVLPFIKQ